MPFARCTFESPLGDLTACATPAGVCLLEFHDRRALATELRYLREHFDTDFSKTDNEHLEVLRTQIAAYFAGTRTEFGVVLDTPGTPFQRRVWGTLLKIPCGKTVSYLGVAKSIDQPAATRAVARANGQNRVSILVPCHRVIGSDGSLTGYGGKLWRKQWLLEHEAKMAGAALSFS